VPDADKSKKEKLTLDIGVEAILEYEAQDLVSTPEALCSALGFPSVEAAPQAVRETGLVSLKEARRLARPRVIYKVLRVENVGSEGIAVQGLPALGSERLAAAFEGADDAVLFAATLGEDMDREIDRLGPDDLWGSFVLDAAAALMTDALASRLRGDLEEAGQETGRLVGVRMGPGFCDWSVRDQAVLFDNLETERIGISLTGGAMMVPRKSLSGLIPLVGGGRTPGDPCIGCARTDCVYRGR